jgi:hypothetical protein
MQLGEASGGCGAPGLRQASSRFSPLPRVVSGLNRPVASGLFAGDFRRFPQNLSRLTACNYLRIIAFSVARYEFTISVVLISGLCFSREAFPPSYAGAILCGPQPHAVGHVEAFAVLEYDVVFELVILF